MTDYISRQAAIKAVHRDANAMLDYAATMLEELPAADVAEVVRCKDCIYWNECRYMFHEGVGTDWHEDDFCSYGERVEE